MKICIIHGSPRKGNTYHATEIFKKELRKYGDIEYKEFFLPKDMPHFCNGCFTCFYKGEEKCPHAQYVQPIANAMREAEGLIFTSPVYVMSESAQIKALLDHFGYIYMPHRPMEEMFSKVAMIICTTAGAGTRHPIKTIARSLNYWGIRRVYSCGFTLYAEKWAGMKTERRQKYEQVLARKANKFHKSLTRREELHVRIFTRVIFGMMKNVISNYSQGEVDRQYWKEKGWMEGKNNPF